MAKQTGIGAGAAVTVDNSSGVAKTITNDVTGIEISTPKGSFDVTGVDKSYVERLLGLGDCKITLKGVFNRATDMSHDVFKTVPTTSVVRTVAITFTGPATLTAEMVCTDYQISRGQDGQLTWTVPMELAADTSFGWT